MRAVLLIGCLLFSVSAWSFEVQAQGMPGAMACGAMGECSRIQSHAPGATSCPAFAATPLFDFDAEAETGYSNNDPVPTFTDQGSNGVNLTQGTGSAQPTYKDPCDATVSKACYDFDGGDSASEIAATFGTFTQANLICVVFHLDGTGTGFVYDGVSGRESLFHSSGTYTHYAGASYGTTIAGVTDQWERNCFIYNGASSTGDHSGTALSGSVGAASLAGLRVGASNVGSGPMNGAVARIVGWDSGYDIADAQAVLDCEYPAGVGAGAAPNPPPVRVSATASEKRYAVALRRRGLNRQGIVARLKAKKGMTHADAVELAKSVRGRRGRDPATLHQREIGLLVRRSHLTAADAAIAQALCKPLSDETDEDAPSCLASEAASLGETFCAVDTKSPVLVYGARLRATLDEVAFLRTASQSVGPLRMVGSATDAAYFTKLQEIGDNLAGAPKLERCQAGTS